MSGLELPESEAVTTYLDPKRPFTNELALRRVIRGLQGNVLWYEQHMTKKNLEPLIEELDFEIVKDVRLLSDPHHITQKVKDAFASFRAELQGRGVDARWRILPANAARDMHARVIVDALSRWELPPLNSLYKGTVDSIHQPQMPVEPFQEAWSSPQAVDMRDFQPPPPPPAQS